MADGFYVITGTSQGIGEALAQTVLAEGNTVLGVARNRSDALRAERYHHLSFDLTETSRIGRIMEKVDEIAGSQAFDFVCLVNNASATEPIGPIETCPAAEIEAHVKIGLIAPMILTSKFIGRFGGEKMRKKVAFISSGAAFTPLQDESIYCSTKAAVNMLAQCVGLEQEQEGGFEVIAIGPGMVDTPMQQAVRSKSRDEFALVDFFRQAYADGELAHADVVARKIYTILGNSYKQGKYVNAGEV